MRRAGCRVNAPFVGLRTRSTHRWAEGGVTFASVVCRLAIPPSMLLRTHAIPFLFLMPVKRPGLITCLRVPSRMVSMEFPAPRKTLTWSSALLPVNRSLQLFLVSQGLCNSIRSFSSTRSHGELVWWVNLLAGRRSKSRESSADRPASSQGLPPVLQPERGSQPLADDFVIVRGKFDARPRTAQFPGGHRRAAAA